MVLLRHTISFNETSETSMVVLNFTFILSNNGLFIIDVKYVELMMKQNYMYILIDTEVEVVKSQNNILTTSRSKENCLLCLLSTYDLMVCIIENTSTVILLFDCVNSYNSYIIVI